MKRLCDILIDRGYADNLVVADELCYQRKVFVNGEAITFPKKLINIYDDVRVVREEAFHYYK